jgi:predicted RNase H-like HicB family nuclease
VAAVPVLPGCVTQAKTEEELARRIQDAAQLYLGKLREADLAPPEFLGVRELALE